jgi:hypothetical protein
MQLIDLQGGVAEERELTLKNISVFIQSFPFESPILNCGPLNKKPYPDVT